MKETQKRDSSGQPRSAQRVPVPDGARQRHGLGLPGGAVGEYERRFERVCRGGVVSVLQRAVQVALEVRLHARQLAERTVEWILHKVDEVWV